MLNSCFRLLGAVKYPTKATEATQLLKTPGKLSVAWFSASWCGPCKAVSKSVETIAEKEGDKINVVKIDIDELADIASEFGVQSVPTFHFLKDGKKIDTVIGASAEKVKAAIEKHK